MIKNKRPKNSNGVFKKVVREVVKEELQGTEKKLKNELQGIEERLDRKIDNSFQKYKDEVVTGLDQVMGELQTIREEFTMHQGQHEEINERLEQLETHPQS